MAEHVVIVGGGIAGTAAALALRTAGIAVTVLDARPADDDSGAVVRINPNGMDALRAVNAHQTILAGSFPLVRTERIGADGARVGYALAADPASDRGLPRVLHWSQLAARLRAVARDRGAVFRHGVRVCDVHESGGDASGGPVTAVLEGGQTVHGDVLVGADGVHSLVRRRIDAEAPAPQRLGTRTVYGFAADPPREPPPPEVLRSYLAPKAFLAATRDSLSGGCFWFTSLPAPEPASRGTGPRDVDGLRTELLPWFAEGTFAADLVRASERILSFDDHALDHLPRWSTGRTVLLGDALHVAPPASEQGAALAIEDGVELARCLRDHPVPAEAFAVFERLRRSRVEAVVARGRVGTSRAHHPLRRRLRALRDRGRRLLDWQRRPPTGGGWTYDHHIDWAARAGG